MRKDRIVKTSIAAIAISMMAIGGSIAYFVADTEDTNKISAPKLDILIKENGEIVSEEVVMEEITPNGIIEKQLYVDNTQTSPAYIRVELNKYWANGQGKKTPDVDASLIGLNYDENDWIVQNNDDNGETVYMYYRYPVESGSKTSNFLNSIQLGNLNNAYTNKQICLDIEADGIQVMAAKEAILAEWGLEVEFDDNGKITYVEE